MSIQRKGFTLIELLVVITIIVVLLALLTPALDKAIYQAELTVCSANQRVTATAAVTYAVDSRRRYPERTLVRAGGAPPNTLVDPIFRMGDDRPVLREHFSINKMFLDPFVEPVNLETTDPETSVMASYAMYYGAQYHLSGNPMPGMLRLGNRWSFTEALDANNSVVKPRMSILISDIDRQKVNNSVMTGSHPDADGLLEQRAYDSTRVPANAFVGGNRYSVQQSIKFAVSMWYNDDRRDRGTIDQNVALEDLSAHRTTDLLYEGDDRVIRVPHFIGGNQWPSEYQHLPPL